MPTAEIIKTETLPDGRKRSFVLVTFDKADRDADRIAAALIAKLQPSDAYRAYQGKR